MYFFSVEETDIIELEKRYWTLKAQSKTGRFDVETFRPVVCPPIPEELCEGKYHISSNNGCARKTAYLE